MDSQYALEIVCDFNFLSQNKLIFTMDITSFYTVIPNDEGLRALKHFFDKRTVTGNLVLKHYSVQPNQYLICLSYGSNYYKLMAQPWVQKWDPAMPIFPQVLSHINFLAAPNLNSTATTLTTASSRFNPQLPEGTCDYLFITLRANSYVFSFWLGG